MSFEEINEGDRPSRLQLARYATDELDYGEKAKVEAWLERNPEELAFLAELEAARADTPDFDAGLLRLRAQSEHALPIVPEPEVDEAPANNNTWMMLVAGAITFAAGVAVAVTMLLTSSGPLEPQVRVKSGADLQVYALDHDEMLRPYQGQVLGAGDVLGFQVIGGSWHEVVVLSVDGDGNISMYYPDGGEQGVLLENPGERVPLPGTVILDNAPGPEVFVAVFGHSVEEATSSVWSQSEAGSEAILDWAARTGWAEAVQVEKAAP